MTSSSTSDFIYKKAERMAGNRIGKQHSTWTILAQEGRVLLSFRSLRQREVFREAWKRRKG